MSEQAAQTSEAAAATGTGSFGSASHLPWHLIPAFDRSETYLTEYARRLDFLAGTTGALEPAGSSGRSAMLRFGPSEGSETQA